MRTWIFPALFEGQDGDWTVTFRDIPEAVTGAADRTQALAQAEDALEEAVLGRLARAEAVPAPSRRLASETHVTLDPVTAARVELVHAMADQGVSNAALARRIGRTEGAVRRLTAGQTTVKLDTVREALTALGRHIGLVVH